LKIKALQNSILFDSFHKKLHSNKGFYIGHGKSI